MKGCHLWMRGCRLLKTGSHRLMRGYRLLKTGSHRLSKEWHGCAGSLKDGVNSGGHKVLDRPRCCRRSDHFCMAKIREAETPILFTVTRNKGDDSDGDQNFRCLPTEIRKRRVNF